MAWQLLVIDGGDEGRFFPLVEDTSVTLGNSRKNTDICLHDLYVARVHCEVSLMGGRILVKDLDSPGGTFVNGNKIVEQEMRTGDVLRIGNSHLRLTPHDASVAEEVIEDAEVVEDAEPEAAPAEPGKLPHLPADRLGELTGHLLGHFEVGSLLGTGFAGAVFRANDKKSGQVVALKVLSPQFPANDHEMQVFIKVIKAALPLRHPHLITLLGAGKAGPYCWIAREYIEGESLDQVIQRISTGGKLNWKHALRLGIHVGRALDCIHRCKQVHGNVTPKNILIRLTDKVVKLSDFLLNKALSNSELQRGALQQKLLDELPYLSPEQTSPGGYVDILADIYCLGAAIYARLTGHPPFQGRTAEQTLALIHDGPLIRPSKYQEGIPPPLEKAVLRMLARQQDHRYEKPADVVAVLEEIAEEEEVEV
jgi:serine/threonine protein kinase